MPPSLTGTLCLVGGVGGPLQFNFIPVFGIWVFGISTRTVEDYYLSFTVQSQGTIFHLLYVSPCSLGAPVTPLWPIRPMVWTVKQVTTTLSGGICKYLLIREESWRFPQQQQGGAHSDHPQSFSLGRRAQVTYNFSIHHKEFVGTLQCKWFMGLDPDYDFFFSREPDLGFTSVERLLPPYPSNTPQSRTHRHRCIVTSLSKFWDWASWQLLWFQREQRFCEGSAWQSSP